MNTQPVKLYVVAQTLGISRKTVKSPEVLVDKIGEQYGLDIPSQIRDDKRLRSLFFDACLLSRKKEQLKRSIIKILRKEQKAILKKRDRGGISGSGHAIKLKSDNFQSKVLDTDWRALSVFFGRTKDELVSISALQSIMFYRSKEWKAIRYFTIQKRGRKCECCGQEPREGVQIHVDHIFPRSIYPDHALNPTNLQVLCSLCNEAKSNVDTTDWRPEQELIKAVSGA